MTSVMSAGATDFAGGATDFGCCAKAAGHSNASTKNTETNLLLIAHLLLKLSFYSNGLSQNCTRRAECFTTAFAKLMWAQFLWLPESLHTKGANKSLRSLRRVPSPARG